MYRPVDFCVLAVLVLLCPNVNAPLFPAPPALLPPVVDVAPNPNTPPAPEPAVGAVELAPKENGAEDEEEVVVVLAVDPAWV